jgi:pimeloyl-ACP methyl ester carboxylesterase
MVRTHATAPRKYSPATLGTELTMDRLNHARLNLPLARLIWAKGFIRMLRPVTSLAAVVMVVLGLGLGLTGCTAPVGTNKRAPSKVYRQTHENALSRSEPSRDTLSVLHRFDQVEQFAKSPDATLELIHRKAVESRDRGLLFALSELNYIEGDRVRRSLKPWETRDARDYYLASAVYAWFFLFGDAAEVPPGPFDQRFRTACDLYNYGLGWALTQRDSTNALAVLAGGTRRLPVGKLDLEFTRENFPWPLADFKSFVLAQQLQVRGLSVRNSRSGLGTPLVAVTKSDDNTKLSRCLPATVVLRLSGDLPELAEGKCRGSLELYSGFDTTTLQVGARSVPLETDTTVALAYGLNQSLLWRLGMAQFFSSEELIPTDVYLSQPYEPGKVPVVFVHGTFSSPVWWAEMFNTLSADPELQKHCQFWYFVYNSGNPTSYSAVKLREALTAKLKALDPEGKDPALRQMVVIGHSQGGLLTKLTGTDTGDKLLQAVLKTNRLEDLKLTPEQQAAVRRYTCFEALPFVTRVVFISTPHRGSYLASSFVRRLARKLVTLPSKMVRSSKELTGLREKLDIPKELKGSPTSLDSMSPRNPIQLALADIPLAPGVKGHSIIAVKGNGDYHKGKDGLVAYDSAHVDYVESEFIVRGPHSCQDLPPTIEEVRRILHEHLASLPARGPPPSGAK